MQGLAIDFGFSQNVFFFCRRAIYILSLMGERACRWIRCGIHGGLFRNKIPGASPHLQEYFSDVLPQQSDQYKLNTAEEEYHHHQRLPTRYRPPDDRMYIKHPDQQTKRKKDRKNTQM